MGFWRRAGVAAATVGGGTWVALNPQVLPWNSRTAPPLCPVPGAAMPTDRVMHGTYDVAVVGGGIIGLATAAEVRRRYPHLRVTVLEKEGEVAGHQTGHNSGVIHAGMYYLPGTTMARCCVEGARLMYEYAEQKGIPCERVGKLICAPSEAEHHQVEELYRRGVANGVEGLRVLNREQVKEIEPNVDVHSALDSPNTGIIDYGVVARQLAADLEAGGADVQLRFQVQQITEGSDGGVEVRGVEPGQRGPLKVVQARNVLTCAGLHMDKVAEAGGGSGWPRVMTFRGRYYQMKPEYRNIVKRNVYPVPSGGGIPVGVHFTPTAAGGRRGQQMIVGPGACLACDKEGYSIWKLDPWHLKDVLTNPGFWRFGINNFWMSIGELWKDASKAAFLAEARRLVPGVEDHMVEDSFVGVMAQVFLDDGKPASDYIFERNCVSGTTLHLRNAPSPAATSSLAIAKEMVDRAEEDFGWGLRAAGKGQGAQQPAVGAPGGGVGPQL
eukprot:TRINITY_DN1340_c2_g1_i4.p1 TRINITY_DN1340_c2_g1~~TRINITY_DN1340_c2_g1_i4.p1  ORF type:complete len:527 (+),score=167.34 TRINITY_DN1340_c2_g1_i4:94-1581(+)